MKSKIDILLTIEHTKTLDPNAKRISITTDQKEFEEYARTASTILQILSAFKNLGISDYIDLENMSHDHLSTAEIVNFNIPIELDKIKLNNQLVSKLIECLAKNLMQIFFITFKEKTTDTYREVSISYTYNNGTKIFDGNEPYVLKSSSIDFLNMNNFFNGLEHETNNIRNHFSSESPEEVLSFTLGFLTQNQHKLTNENDRQLLTTLKGFYSGDWKIDNSTAPCRALLKYRKEINRNLILSVIHKKLKNRNLDAAPKMVSIYSKNSHHYILISNLPEFIKNIEPENLSLQAYFGYKMKL